ncbi:MAG: response regulator [Ignavibacteria bacterium]|nr:response regulator [Ignavibacteria bacterium]
MTILVVDDEASYRILMKSLLTQDKHDVLMAEDGEEALEKLDEHPIDLVISDIYMPVMDGFKFHKAVRASEKHARVPILFVSAYDDQLTTDAVQNPKIDDFLKKARPYNEMRERIRYLTAPEDQRSSRLPGSRFGARFSRYLISANSVHS